MEWFRSWHGAPTDTKWLVIARKAKVIPGIVSAVAWALFDYASQNDERGSVDGFDVETYAEYSGFPEQDVANTIIAMREKNVIDSSNRLSSWDKRQPKREDNSTDRVRSFRERHAQDETHGNAAKRDETHGNAPEKNRTDTEQNRNRSGASAGAAPPPPLPAAVRVFEDNGGKYKPGKLKDGTTYRDKARQFIAENVRDDPASLELWRKVVDGYCAQWSATSYTTMVNEFYAVGRIPGQSRSNGNGRPAASNTMVTIQARESRPYHQPTDDELARAQAEWDAAPTGAQLRERAAALPPVPGHRLAGA